ncbi:efflux RND transporter permease subunit, partial [Morganella morganii]|uniref:efflux RND transporter permease subunit n=1 Tax=Morganella morganii TaxID=582 RepID=UPI0015F7509B
DDPAGANIAAFAGIDGSNATLNTGRLQITLKPLSERADRAEANITRLQEKADSLPGVKLYLQPSQDLTIDNHTSRTQDQFTL